MQDALHQRQLGFQGECWGWKYALPYAAGYTQDYTVDGTAHRIEVALELCRPSNLPSQATVRWAFLHGLKMLAFERIFGQDRRGITLLLAFVPQQFSNLPPYEFTSLVHCLERQNSWILGFASKMDSYVGDCQKTYDEQNWFDLFDSKFISNKGIQLSLTMKIVTGQVRMQPKEMGSRSDVNAFAHQIPSIPANGGQIMSKYPTPPLDNGHIHARQGLGNSMPLQAPAYGNAGRNSGYPTILQAPLQMNAGRNLGHSMPLQGTGLVYGGQNLVYPIAPRGFGQVHGGQKMGSSMAPQAFRQGYGSQNLQYPTAPQASGHVHASQDMGSSMTSQASGQEYGGPALESTLVPEASGLGQAQPPNPDTNAFGSMDVPELTNAGKSLTDLTTSSASADVNGAQLMTPQASDSSSQGKYALRSTELV